MIAQSKLARLDSRVRKFLEMHFADRPSSLAELTGLWQTYARLQLPNNDFVAEFTNGKPASLAQRTWELLLAQHLRDQGHGLKCVGDGPDLLIETNGSRIWVEAVSPEPKGLPPDWLEPFEPGKVRMLPHEKLLLRWTTAFSAKVEKYKNYLAKGTVLPTDAYVIAINGCQLALTPTAHGITQMPFGVETVFPVGPLKYEIDRETRKFERASISERFHILNHNSAEVATTSFLNPAYAGISAVIGCAADRRHGRPLAIHVVHNPLAAVPAPMCVWGASGDE